MFRSSRLCLTAGGVVLCRGPRVERTAANDGIVPSNIGLDGTIGGECDGKWWGGETKPPRCSLVVRHGSPPYSRAEGKPWRYWFRLSCGRPAGVYGWGFSCVDIHDLPTDTPALELEKQGLATRVWRG